MIKGADFSNVAVEQVTPIEPTPDGYVYYDFIVFDGNSYVATNVTTKANTKVETAAVVTGWSTGIHAGHILGTRSGTLYESNDKFTIQIGVADQGGISASVGNMQGYQGESSVDGQFNTKYTFSVNSSNIIINGVSHLINVTLSPGTYPFFLGNTNEGGTPLQGGQFFEGKIYETKFYEGDTLIADYKPCININNSRVGFYDVIERHFYGNSGTGTLTAGNE